MKKLFSLVSHPVFAVLIFFAFSCSKDPVTPEDTETLIRNAVDAGDIPSVAACIIKNDHIVWEFAYGYANKEKGRPASDETIYLLASVSKPVVGTAVMQLVEQGFIDLDEDIGQYLPFLLRNPQYPDAKITTRMVLAHRSGLGWPVSGDSDFYTTYFGDSAPPFYPWIEEFIVPGGSEYDPSMWKNTAPGEQYWYSNFGAALLGYLVETVSGEDFKEYCKKYIFQPLDMPDTSFRFSDLDSTRVAMPYRNNDIPVGHFTYIYYPAACLRSSISDFSHFIIAYMNGGVYMGNRILKESSIEEMLTLHYPDNQVGLIWKLPGDGWVEHSGSMSGVRTQVEFHRDDRVGILVFSNGENGHVQRGGLIYQYVQEDADQYR